MIYFLGTFSGIIRHGFVLGTIFGANPRLPLKNDDFIEQESRDKLQEHLVKKERLG